MEINFLKIIIVVLAVMVSVNGHASREVGNGGVGVFCENESDPVKRVQLFDLYEGQSWFNLPVLPAPTSNELEYALSFASHLDEVIKPARSFNFRLTGVYSSMQFMPDGVRLVLTDDIKNFIYDPACKLVQILNYKDGLVYVDKEYWDQLTPVHKAAAILHEAIYAFARERGETGSLSDGDQTSERTRHVVALLMAGTKLEKINDDDQQPKEAKRFVCSTEAAKSKGHPSTQFKMYVYPNNSTHITFTRLDGLSMLTLTTLDFAGSLSDRSLVGSIQSLIDSDIRVEFSTLSSLRETQMTVTRNGARSAKEDVPCFADYTQNTQEVLK